jgi:hypothetical protein
LILNDVSGGAGHHLDLVGIGGVAAGPESQGLAVEGVKTYGWLVKTERSTWLEASKAKLRKSFITEGAAKSGCRESGG